MILTFLAIYYIQMSREIKTLSERFWTKVDRSGGAEACWTWTGTKNAAGYGMIYGGPQLGKSVLAHRVSWKMSNGAIPDDFPMVTHSCDNPACVNPAHLSLGDHWTNMQDKRERGRCSRSRIMDQLKPEQVLEIRFRVANGQTQMEVAKQFDVTYATVSNIVHRRTWKHI